MTHMYFYAEGNKGADYLRITLPKMGDDMVEIEVGHCCVVTVRKRIPVEIITSILSKIFCLDENPEDFLEFNNDYNQELLKRIKDLE